MHVSTTPLGELATRIMGRRVLVHLGHSLPWSVRGLASYDRAGCPVIELNPPIFESKAAHELGEVFWHELGHHLLLHTSEARPRPGPLTPADVAQAVKYAAETAAGRAKEEAADAFAQAMRKQVSDDYLWALCTS